VVLAFYVYFNVTNGDFFGMGAGTMERIVSFPVMIWALLVGLAILAGWITDAPAIEAADRNEA